MDHKIPENQSDLRSDTEADIREYLVLFKLNRLFK